MKPLRIADVGVEARIAAAVDDGAVPDDRVERRGLRRSRQRRGERDRKNCSESRC